MEMEKRLVFPLLLFLALALAVSAVAAESLQLSGNTPLNNCSVQVVNGSIVVTQGARTDGKIELIGFNGYNLTYVYGGVVQHFNITGDVLIFDPKNTLAKWTVYVLDGEVVITAAPTLQLDPFAVFSAPKIITFYEDVWSFFAYAVVLLVPVSIYVRTRSPGGAALTLLFMAAGGVVLAPSFRPIGVLIIVGATAFLLYKIFRGE